MANDPTVKDSTLNEKNGRYVLGGDTEVSTFALEWWERKTLQKDPTDFAYYMELAYVGRPDLLANAFYGDSNLWWLICQYNNIIDPQTELVEGKLLLMPDPTRLNAILRADTNVGGIVSTRETSTNGNTSQSS